MNNKINKKALALNQSLSTIITVVLFFVALTMLSHTVSNASTQLPITHIIHHLF